MTKTIQALRQQLSQHLAYNIRAAEFKDIPAIHDLGAETLGEGYLTHKKLRHDLSKHVAHVATYQDQVVGYCISERLPPGGLAIQLQDHPVKPYPDLLEADQQGKLGLLQSAGVDVNFRRRGIAGNMVRSGMTSLLDQGCTAIIGLAWTTETIHIGGVLNRLGFQARARYPAFWKQESIDHNYTCPVCNSPCVCDMVLFSLVL